MTDTTWVVTLAPDQDIAATQGLLKQAGFTVGATLDAIGVITGAGDAAAIARVRAIPGVADVAPDDAIDIGPPGSPDTW